MAFRTTPTLGPQVEDVFATLPYWDAHGGITTPSYELGTKVTGSDGHEYIFVQNDTSNPLAASARFNVADDGTFALTTNSSGTFMAPPDEVPAGAFFHARRFAL